MIQIEIVITQNDNEEANLMVRDKKTKRPLRERFDAQCFTTHDGKHNIPLARIKELCQAAVRPLGTLTQTLEDAIKHNEGHR